MLKHDPCCFDEQLYIFLECCELLFCLLYFVYKINTMWQIAAATLYLIFVATILFIIYSLTQLKSIRKLWQHLKAQLGEEQT